MSKMTQREHREDFCKYREALDAALIAEGMEPTTFYEAYGPHFQKAEIPYVVEVFKESVREDQEKALRAG